MAIFTSDKKIKTYFLKKEVYTKTELILVFAVIAMIFSSCSLLSESKTILNEGVVEAVSGNQGEITQKAAEDVMIALKTKDIKKLKSLFSIQTTKRDKNFNKKVDDFFSIVKSVEYSPVALSSFNNDKEYISLRSFPEQEWVDDAFSAPSSGDSEKSTAVGARNDLEINGIKYKVMFSYCVHYKQASKKGLSLTGFGGKDDSSEIGIFYFVIFRKKDYNYPHVQILDENGYSKPSVTDDEGFYFYP